MDWQDHEKYGKITREMIFRVLRYDAFTGDFYHLRYNRWTKTYKWVRLERNKWVYRSIKIYGYAFKLHRLAWIMFNGEWPVDIIDHINFFQGDNRILNLQDITQKANVERQILKGKTKDHAAFAQLMSELYGVSGSTPEKRLPSELTSIDNDIMM